MIKAVLLDVDNTLLDFDRCAEASMVLAAEEFDIALPENAFEAFRAVNDVLWLKIEQGQLTIEELYRIRWNRVFERIGISGDGPAFEEAFLRCILKSAVPVQGAMELIQDLDQKGYLLCVASNAPYEQQLRRLEKAGFRQYLKKIFISERLGYAKPHREFFRACHEELDPLLPEEIIMIGDSLPADIEGAHAYGFQTCWYEHKHREIPTPEYADYRVQSLAEIREIL